MNVANAAGVNIPLTIGDWPGGGGVNPGNFGEDLVGIGAERIAGNPANDTGTCN